MAKRPEDMTLEERATAFSAAFDYGNDPAITLVDLVRAAGDFLAKIVGAESADAGMKRILGTMASPGEATWREDLEENESGAFSEWPLGQMLHDLSAYAEYGIDLSAREHETEEQVSARLADMIEGANAFFRLCPLETWLGENRPPQLEETILLARNRWALDHDRPIEPEALSLFGGVKMSRMRNMLSGKDPELPRQDGLVPAFEAKEWLKGRGSFFPSIWRTARPMHDSTVAPYAHFAPIFVPEAKDGSVFHPGLERRNGFTIGEKGHEIQVPAFEEALRQLQEMPFPAWRRPASDRGGWGIVRGVTWTRVSLAELDSRARSELERQKVLGENPEAR